MRVDLRYNGKMSDVVQEIKNKLDIVEFIGSYVTLKKAGRNFKANCPFHQEKSPSFVISPDRQIWHCFGSCHEGGDVIKFLMKWENIPFIDAVKDLAARVGVTVNFSDADDEKTKTRDTLYAINYLSAKYYHYIYAKTKQGERARAYIEGRGINEKVAQTFQIGYAPSSWDSLLSYLRKKGYRDELIEQAGLALASSKTRSLYDRFRGRIVFPIQDTRGNVVGFSGRVLVGDGEGAKYINTPETTIYHKRETLFGIFQSKEGIKKQGYALLVEGEFDVISPFQNGVDNAVAVKGSAITSEQLALIKRYAPKIVFAMDADGSGADAVRRGTLEADRLEMESEVLVLDGGKDPDEAVRNNPIGFKKSLAHTLPIYDFLFENLMKQHNVNDPYGKIKVVDGIVEHLRFIHNPIIQSHYIKKFAGVLELSERSIEDAIRKKRKISQERAVIRQSRAAPVDKKSREQIVELYIMSLLLQGALSHEVGHICETLEGEDFSQPAFAKLFTTYKTFYHHTHEPGASFADSLPGELVDAYNEAYLYATFDESFAQGSTMRLVYEIKRASLKRKLSTILAQEDSSTMQKDLQTIQLQLTEVEKHMSSL